MEISNFQNSFIYLFNKDFIQFLRTIKSFHPNLKSTIKKSFKSIDKSDSQYIQSLSNTSEHFLSFCNSHISHIFESNNSSSYISSSMDFFPFNNINFYSTFSPSYLNSNSFSKIDFDIFKFFFKFYFFSYLYNETYNIANNSNDLVEDILDDDIDNDQTHKFTPTEQIIDLTQNILSFINNPSSFSIQSIENMLSQYTYPFNKNIILSYSTAFIHIYNSLIHNTDDTLDDTVDDIIGNSTLGNITKEIMKDINLDSLNLSDINPNDLDISKILSGDNNGNNPLNDVVQKVGNVVSQKMSSGELDVENIMGDIMKFIGNSQNNSSNKPDIANMMASMMGGSGINDLMNNMLNPNKSQTQNNNPNMNDLIKNLSNNDISNLQNQIKQQSPYPPNSREAKMRDRLQKKLNNKNKDN
jgi:hypothetical protein